MCWREHNRQKGATVRAVAPFALRRLVLGSLAGVALASLPAIQASASLCWNWNYSGDGITASGTLVTTETPDGSGFYLITGITGTRNGEPITGLQTTGTAIPGNEPYAVDNLIRVGGPQLTHSGFGYALKGGTYANPFFTDSPSPARYLEFFSAQPFTKGVGADDSELPVSFTATLMDGPKISTANCS